MEDRSYYSRIIVTGIVSSISFIYTNNVANLGYFVLVSNILNLIIPMD